MFAHIPSVRVFVCEVHVVDPKCTTVHSKSLILLFYWLWPWKRKQKNNSKPHILNKWTNVGQQSVKLVRTTLYTWQVTQRTPDGTITLVMIAPFQTSQNALHFCCFLIKLGENIDEPAALVVHLRISLLNSMLAANTPFIRLGFYVT